MIATRRAHPRFLAPWAMIAAEGLGLFAIIFSAMWAVEPIGRLLCAWVGK